MPSPRVLLCYSRDLKSLEPILFCGHHCLWVLDRHDSFPFGRLEHSGCLRWLDIEPLVYGRLDLDQHEYDHRYSWSNVLVINNSQFPLSLSLPSRVCPLCPNEPSRLYSSTRYSSPLALVPQCLHLKTLLLLHFTFLLFLFRNSISCLSLTLLFSSTSLLSKLLCSFSLLDLQTHPFPPNHNHTSFYLFPPTIPTLLLLSILTHLSFHSSKCKYSSVYYCYSVCYYCSYFFSCYSSSCSTAVTTVTTIVTIIIRIITWASCFFVVVSVESNEELRWDWRNVQWRWRDIGNLSWLGIAWGDAWDIWRVRLFTTGCSGVYVSTHQFYRSPVLSIYCSLHIGETLLKKSSCHLFLSNHLDRDLGLVKVAFLFWGRQPIGPKCDGLAMWSQWQGRQWK